MPRLTSDTTMLARITSGASMQMFRRKVHRMRRLTCGDITALDDNEPGSSSALLNGAIENNMSEHYRAPGESLQFYDLLVHDVEEGRSNGLYQGVRTLIFQTASVFPEFEFNKLEPKLAAINSGYLDVRMAECAARQDVRLALADYIIGGLGCCMVSLEDEKPCIKWVDILDMSWDLSARLPHQIMWASCIFRQPLHRWLDMFDGRKYDLNPLKDLLAQSGSDAQSEVPVALHYYFDKEGDSGTHSVWLMQGDGVRSEPIYIGPNPYVMSCAGVDHPILPFEWMHCMALPSVKMPPSIVEMMLPAMIGKWNSDRYIREIIDTGKPFYEMQQGAYKAENLNAWMHGEQGVVLERADGKDPMRVAAPLEIPPTLKEYRAECEQELVAQSGANPYASGGRVEGIQYASEVAAIQGNSGLMAGTIAKDSADFWERLARKMLAVGAKYDDLPIDIRYDEDIVLHFDATDPIMHYLKPDGGVVVQENTFAMMPRMQREQMALAKLNVFMNPLLAQKYPSALEQAVEDYLRATGEKNPAAWMQPAPQQQAAPQDAMGGAMAATPPTPNIPPMLNVQGLNSAIEQGAPRAA